MFNKKLELLRMFYYGLIGYFFTVFLISFYYHENNSYAVLVTRISNYLSASIVPFLVSIILVAILAHKKIFRNQSLIQCQLWVCLSSCSVSFLTSFLYFIPHLHISRELGLQELSEALIYGLVASGMSMLYASPGAIGFGLLIGYQIHKKVA